MDEASLRSMDTLHLVHKLINKLQAPFSTYLQKQYKITFNEFRLLMIIGQFPGSASHELAELTGVTPMSVHRAISTLERNKRIEVRRDEKNGRRKVLALTEEGQTLYEAMQTATDLVAAYLLSHLKSQEIALFNKTLHSLIDALEATDSAGQSLFLKATKPSATESKKAT